MWKGNKYPLCSYRLTPDIAIVDSRYGEKLVFAGFDALVHAVESIVLVFASDFTWPLFNLATKLVSENLAESYQAGTPQAERRCITPQPLRRHSAFLRSHAMFTLWGSIPLPTQKHMTGSFRPIATEFWTYLARQVLWRKCASRTWVEKNTLSQWLSTNSWSRSKNWFLSGLGPDSLHFERVFNIGVVLRL